MGGWSCFSHTLTLLQFVRNHFQFLRRRFFYANSRDFHRNLPHFSSPAQSADRT
nr:MAG TPA: hypothetical protein [Caudoviricetes sp.]